MVAGSKSFGGRRGCRAGRVSWPAPIVKPGSSTVGDAESGNILIPQASSLEQ